MTTAIDSQRPPAAAVPHRLGEFEIEGMLGQGGSGVVYAARLRGQPVALKVLKPDAGSGSGSGPGGDHRTTEDDQRPSWSQKDRERFVQEAVNLSRLDHPNIVKVYAVGELEDGRPYLAMEKLEGTSLAERVMMTGALPLVQALSLFDQLADAVAALHGAGLIHRDIKPENVMLVDHGRRAVLLDFGIAKADDAAPSTTTRLGLQRGTPAYMAPERFFGAGATRASDVYELAVTLYVMICGKLPWRDPRDAQQRLDPKPPSAHGVILPPGLEAALLEAMQATAESRTQTVVRLAEAVRRGAWDGETSSVAAAESPHAPAQAPHAPGQGREQGRPRRRLGLVLGLVGLGVAAGAVVTVVALSGGGDTKDATASPTTVAAGLALDAGAPEAPSPPPVLTPDAAPLTAGAVDAGPAAAPPPRPSPDGKPKHDKDRSAKPAPLDAGAADGAEAVDAAAATGKKPPAWANAGMGARLPTCRKILALYCTDEFKGSEGGLAGALCTNFGLTVKSFEDLPEPSRTEQGEWCQSNYPMMAAAVAERLRQYRAGTGPVKPPDAGTK